MYVNTTYICMSLHNMAMLKYNSLQGQSGDLPSTVAISSIVGSCGLPMSVLEHGPNRQHDPSLCFWCTVSMHDLTLQLKILNWNGPSWHKNGSKKKKHQAEVHMEYTATHQPQAVEPRPLLSIRCWLPLGQASLGTHQYCNYSALAGDFRMRAAHRHGHLFGT